MFHKKTLLTLLVAGFILSTGIGATYAFSGDGIGWGKNIDPEKLEEMQQKKEQVVVAVETGDYTAWLEAIGLDSKMAGEVTAEEFPTLIQAHNLMQEGKEKFEEAHELRESIGLTQGFGQGRMGTKGFGLHKFNK